MRRGLNGMSLFRRKSKWDHIMDAVATAAANDGLRRAGKVALGLVGGAAAATAASAIVSTARQGEK